MPSLELVCVKYCKCVPAPPPPPPPVCHPDDGSAARQNVDTGNFFCMETGVRISKKIQNLKSGLTADFKEDTKFKVGFNGGF